MKKIIYILTLILCLFLTTSCIEEEAQKVTVISPSGAPTFGVSYALDDELFDYNITNGADALRAAFINQEYDMILAPVNLGATLYNSLNKFDYVFYQNIVGGCFYLVTSENFEKIEDLNNQKITVFGANSTPDVMIRSIIKHYNLDVEITYVNDVSEANATLVSGKAKTIISAEPSISKFNKTNKYKTINLQEEWKKISGKDYAVPQAGLFIKKSKLDEPQIKKALEKINQSLAISKTDPKTLATSAVKVDGALEKIGIETLEIASPKCNFVTNKYNVLEIEFYFNKLIELDLAKTIGGKLPDEGFYA